jgi:hypothetical protein
MISQHEWLLDAIPEQRDTGILLHDLSGDEFHRLVKTVCPGRLQPGFDELLNDVRFCLSQAFTPGVSALQTIIRYHFDMFPPRFSGEVFRRLLRMKDRR